LAITWIHVNLVDLLPQEENRLTIAREILEVRIDNICRPIVRKCVELILSLNKVGSSEWDDNKVKKVIMLASLARDHAFHSLFRQ
jgi:hypothetical protein